MKVNQKPKLHRNWIDPHAFGIVRALQREGFTTYLVGGCVRDLLLGISPKDFDIATDARPEQVRRIIHRAFVIGKRFRLVLVKRDEQQFEVATFRREQKREEVDGEIVPAGDNVFGSPEEDALRRDFTINGLFYDPVRDQLIDHCQGTVDLGARIVRMIGDPDVRLAEDPIRILRALRLAHMIGFQLDENLRAGMARYASTLPATALPRRREELLKLIRLKEPDLAFLEAHDLGILHHLSPHLAAVFEDSEKADIFLTHLRQIHDFAVDKQNATELFALLVLAYVRAAVQPDVTLPLKASEWEEHPQLGPLMHNELGIFKFEQQVIAKALHLQSLLRQVEEFSRRGVRRQLAVLRNESFHLALTLAERDRVLTGSEILFWHQALEKAQEDLAALPNDSRKRRRRRRRQVVATELVEAGLVPTDNEDEIPLGE
jgi:poly(A) polymerase